MTVVEPSPFTLPEDAMRRLAEMRPGQATSLARFVLAGWEKAPGGLGSQRLPGETSGQIPWT